VPVSCGVDPSIYRRHTGFEMIRTLASGAFSATALAKSRTMEALVLNKSRHVSRGTCDNDRIIHTITSHAGLARHTSGNDNDVGALERICKT
jgi:hypothetical protein